MGSNWNFDRNYFFMGFLAKRFMKETEKYDVLTLSDYLAVRFGQKANVIRWLASLLIVGLMIFYIGAQMAGAGKILFTTFNLPIIVGVVLSCAVIIFTSFSGGFISVVWTDMIQSLMMIVTLVGLPIVAFTHIVANDISVTDSLLKAGDSFDAWFGGLSGFAIGVLFFNNFSWFFGFLGGQPQLSARFMALKNEKEANQGTIVATVWTILAYVGAFSIGIAGIALYNQGSFSDVETMMPTMVLELMPPWIAGIILAGVLAAINSTANSQIMVITSSITEDIVHKTLKLRLTEKQLILLSPYFHYYYRFSRYGNCSCLGFFSVPSRQLGLGRDWLYVVSSHSYDIFLETLFKYWSNCNNYFRICFNCFMD